MVALFFLSKEACPLVCLNTILRIKKDLQDKNYGRVAPVFAKKTASTRHVVAVTTAETDHGNPLIMKIMVRTIDHTEQPYNTRATTGSCPYRQRTHNINGQNSLRQDQGTIYQNVSGQTAFAPTDNTPKYQRADTRVCPFSYGFAGCMGNPLWLPLNYLSKGACPLVCLNTILRIKN